MSLGDILDEEVDFGFDENDETFKSPRPPPVIAKADATPADIDADARKSKPDDEGHDSDRRRDSRVRSPAQLDAQRKDRSRSAERRQPSNDTTR